MRLGLIRGGIAALRTAGVAIILVSAAPPPALAQTSVDSEGLLSYVTTGKLKLGKRISLRNAARNLFAVAQIELAGVVSTRADS